MAYEQKPGRGQTPFGEVLESKGLINVIKNPKRAIKEAKQVRVDRLREELASKPSSSSNTFYNIERTKDVYNKRLVDGKEKQVLVDPGHYERVGNKPTMGKKGQEEVYRERLTKKETKTYLKNKYSGGDDKYRPWFEMRKELKKSRPNYHGRDVSKAQKLKWKKAAGDKALGIKNKLKRSYGFGKPVGVTLDKALKEEYRSSKSGGGITGPGKAPGAGSNQSFCTAKGGCKQVNP